MSRQRNWRPPWEEVETRTGGYYGGPGCATTLLDGGGGGGGGGGNWRGVVREGGCHPCGEDGSQQPRRYHGTSSERQLMIRKPMFHADPRDLQHQREQRKHYRPLEYCGISESFDRDDGYFDLPEPLDSYGQSPYVRRQAASPYDPNDGYYYPPQQRSRVSEREPYSYGRQGYAGANDRRRGDVVAYGLGLPVRDDNSRAYGISPPPLTISTSSGLTLSTSSGPTDDSSDGSRDGGPGGSCLDPPDGCGGGGGGGYDGTESPPPPLRDFKSLGPANNEQQPPPKKRTMVELVPGMKMLLRGASETWEAFQRNLCVVVACVGCSARIFCIKDADYVLCPLCRVVSPLEISSTTRPSSQWRRHRVGGLGLGFTGELDLHRSLRGKTKLDETTTPKAARKLG